MRMRGIVLGLSSLLLIGLGSTQGAVAAESRTCVIDAAEGPNVCIFSDDARRYLDVFVGQLQGDPGDQGLLGTGSVAVTAHVECFTPNASNSPNRFIVDVVGVRVVDSADLYPTVCPLLYP